MLPEAACIRLASIFDRLLDMAMTAMARDAPEAIMRSPVESFDRIDSHDGMYLNHFEE
jgi:hypothetical protein